MITLDIWIVVPPRTVNTLMDLWEHAGFRACSTLGACALVALERAIELEEVAWYLSHVPPAFQQPEPHEQGGLPEDPDNLVDLFLALPAPLVLRVDNARVTSAIAHMLPRVTPRAQYVGDLVVVGARALAREHAARTQGGADLCPEEEDA